MDHNDATVPAEEMSRILLAEKKADGNNQCLASRDNTSGKTPGLIN